MQRGRTVPKDRAAKSHDRLEGAKVGNQCHLLSENWKQDDGERSESQDSTQGKWSDQRGVAPAKLEQKSIL